MARTATLDQAVILVREGTLNPRATSPDWRQYIVVTDACTVVIEMVPALLGGWRFAGRTVQDGDAWSGMARDSIVAWKLANDDRASIATDLRPDFRERLLDRASGEA